MAPLAAAWPSLNDPSPDSGGAWVCEGTVEFFDADGFSEDPPTGMAIVAGGIPSAVGEGGGDRLRLNLVIHSAYPSDLMDQLEGQIAACGPFSEPIYGEGTEFAQLATLAGIDGIASGFTANQESDAAPRCAPSPMGPPSPCIHETRAFHGVIRDLYVAVRVISSTGLEETPDDLDALLEEAVAIVATALRDA